jgi:hypothetical protein
MVIVVRQRSHHRLDDQAARAVGRIQRESGLVSASSSFRLHAVHDRCPLSPATRHPGIELKNRRTFDELIAVGKVPGCGGKRCGRVRPLS